jgi:hypothetical protein
MENVLSGSCGSLHQRSHLLLLSALNDGFRKIEDNYLDIINAFLQSHNEIPVGGKVLKFTVKCIANQ